MERGAVNAKAAAHRTPPIAPTRPHTSAILAGVTLALAVAALVVAPAPGDA